MLLTDASDEKLEVGEDAQLVEGKDE